MVIYLRFSYSNIVVNEHVYDLLLGHVHLFNLIAHVELRATKSTRAKSKNEINAIK